MANISNNRFEKAAANLKSGKKKSIPAPIPEPAADIEKTTLSPSEKESDTVKETAEAEKVRKERNAASKQKNDSQKYMQTLALSAIKKERGMPKTVYLDAETVKILEELGEKTGAKTSPIVNLLIKIGYENLKI